MSTTKPKICVNAAEAFARPVSRAWYFDSVLKRTGLKNGEPTSGFAERLKSLRIQRNMAQIELAEKAGVSNILISRYERGITKPTAESLKKIADILEVSSDYLFDGSEEGAARVKFSDRRVLSAFQELENLPDGEKEFILSVLTRLLKAHKFESLAAT